jgi:Leucine-rich repeat (LRR) protein
LENLIELHVNNNKLTYIPHELAELKNIKFLYCENNAIDSFHTDIYEIDGLQITY